jgi:hypothetical protein
MDLYQLLAFGKGKKLTYKYISSAFFIVMSWQIWVRNSLMKKFLSCVEKNDVFATAKTGRTEFWFFESKKYTIKIKCFLCIVELFTLHLLVSFVFLIKPIKRRKHAWMIVCTIGTSWSYTKKFLIKILLVWYHLNVDQIA